MSTTADISDRIDRLEAFEERLGVSLEGLSAFVEWAGAVSGGWEVEVRGEVHARNGDRISQSVDLVAALYDSDGNVVRHLEDSIDAETFFIFEPFKLSDWFLPTDVYSRVLVYPIAHP